MLNHYFILSALKEEYRRAFTGHRVEEIYSQQKQVLTLAFRSPDDQRHALIISIDPALCYICRERSHARAKKNSVNLFQPLIGATLTDIAIVPFDRILLFQFSTGQQLRLHLFQTASSNIYLTHGRGAIDEAFKHNNEVAGTILPAPKSSFQPAILKAEDLLARELSAQGNRPIGSALRSVLPFLGRIYADDLAARADIDPNKPAAELSPAEFSRLFAATAELLRASDTPAPILYRNADEVLVSVIPLHSHANWNKEEFPSVDAAVAAVRSLIHRERSHDSAKKTMLDALGKELRRTVKSRSASEAQLASASRAEEYELFGNLILANISTFTRGASSIEVPNILGDGGMVRIPLEPRLSPSMNAERYFHKARESRAAADESRKRTTELRRREQTIEQLLAGLEPLLSSEELEEFTTMHREELGTFDALPEEKKEVLPPFRIFTVAGGLAVWVGKSSANNDLLTTRYASPNDLWFHVRGASGSHTVLKVQGKEPPPKEAVRQAAAIAAYYSKMRNARTVPVAYCQRKYVRKPKGAAQGAVVLEREEIVFVNPSLP